MLFMDGEHGAADLTGGVRVANSLHSRQGAACQKQRHLRQQGRGGVGCKVNKVNNQAMFCINKSSGWLFTSATTTL
jgi:hypothetical protein